MKVLLVVVGLIGTTIVTSFLGGICVMYPWNWLVPIIFGLAEITFWEAFGLTLLCNILFKSYSTTQKS